MVRDLTLEDFVELTAGWDLNKSFSAQKVAIRTKYIVKYYNEWVRFLFTHTMADGINKNTTIDKDVADWVLSGIDKVDVRRARGYYNRMESIFIMFQSIRPQSKMSYTCTVFSVKRSGVESATNYAYMYSIIDADLVGASVQHQYFCTGPNIESSDGEYRGRFISMFTITRISKFYTELLDEVEDYLVNKPKLTFDSSHYLAPGVSARGLAFLKSDVDTNRFAIKLFVVAWLSEGFMLHHKLQSKGVDKIYNSNMFDDEDARFMAHLVSVYTVKTLQLFYLESGCVNTFITSMSNTPVSARFSPTLGQKIIPLGKEEALYPMDIKFPAWREIYISELVSDLWVNMVCPGVPYTHDWVYVYGVDAHVFNNPALVRVMSGEGENNNVHVVSDKGVVVISEYVGRPLNDVARLLESEMYASSVRRIFSDAGVFEKYLFDITYTLLCLNTRLDIIHGDLHLNNTTIHHTRKNYIHGDENTDMTVAYVLAEEAYEFKDTGMVGTVIDFSRSFIIPREKELFTQIKDAQSERIAAYYAQVFPDFFKAHAAALETALDRDFKRVFRLFTAIDLYVHTDRLIKYAEKNAIIKMHPKNAALVEKVNTMSRGYLIASMERLVSGGAGDDWDAYPNERVLLECFGHRKIKGPTGDLSGVYFHNNPLAYNLREYERMPPRLKCMRLKKEGDSTVVEIPNNDNVRTRSLKNYMLSRKTLR